MVSNTVFASLPPTAVVQPTHPPTIAPNWIKNLIATALIDMWCGMIGSQGRNYDGRMLSSESDILPALVKRVAQDPDGATSKDCASEETPKFEDVLGRAKVWPSFDQVATSPKRRGHLLESVPSSGKITTSKVAFSSGAIDEVHLPSHIKGHWRQDLENALRADIKNKQFGPRRHILPMGYTLMYRVDVEECILLSLTADGNSSPTVTDDSITLFDALQTAQVWLTYLDEECENIKPDEATVSGVVLSSPTPSQLSQVTLVEDETSDALKTTPDTPKAKNVTFCDAPTIFHISTKAAPSPRLLPPGLGGYTNRHRFTSHPSNNSAVKLRSALKSRIPPNGTPVHNGTAIPCPLERPALASSPRSSVFQTVKKVLAKFARPPLLPFGPMQSGGLHPGHLL